MCPGCGKCWSALQLLWSSLYVICGAAQLIAGIFFLISIPALHLNCNIWTGSWNIIIGIVGGMMSFLGKMSSRRQEFLLYLAVSILSVNCINLVLSEWGLYFYDMTEILKTHPNHMLIDYACFATRIATATILLVSFLDSQFAFCSMQISTTPTKINKKKIHGSHDQVSDIEYIIPRPKPTKHSTVYNAYSQSWVFDSDSAGCSRNLQTPYLKILDNDSSKDEVKSMNGGVDGDAITQLTDNPMVHIEEASDDSASNSDRKLNHMKSFSRSVSPVQLSPSSSHISLSQDGNTAIYDCLETIYRSRLNSSNSNNNNNKEECHYQAPQTKTMRRVESVSPHAEKVQYASLMKELQKAIVSKKESSTTPPLSTSDSATASEKTPSRSDGQSSDAEFSKELEAALKLIQDLESPNTIETPSEPKSDGKENRPLAVWRSESETTLSAVGSLAEIASPPHSFRKAANGKGASIIIHQSDSQSTSGYSSPLRHTPTWSTTSSLNGSSTDIVKPLAYSIHNAKSTTVISLYSQDNPHSKGKSVTLVNISGDCAPSSLPVVSSPLDSDRSKGVVWNVRSLLRKKRPSHFPKLCPELEGAIIKSESLAYLSDLELLARHQRNTDIQRKIEERVIQQLGVPRTESNC